MIINDDDPVRSRLPAGPDPVDSLGGFQRSGHGGDILVEDHKLIVRRFYDEVVSAGHLDVVDELAHEDMHDHAAVEMGLGSGRGGFRRHVKAVPSWSRTSPPRSISWSPRMIWSSCTGEGAARQTPSSSASPPAPPSASRRSHGPVRGGTDRRVPGDGRPREAEAADRQLRSDTRRARSSTRTMSTATCDQLHSAACHPQGQAKLALGGCHAGPPSRG